MCGIAGFIDLKGRSNTDVLRAMTDQQFHRGPDGSGTTLLQYKTSTIGLGHRRLAIIDLSETGHQPMAFGQLTITFNGEIYNYQEIKMLSLFSTRATATYLLPEIALASNHFSITTLMAYFCLHQN